MLIKVPTVKTTYTSYDLTKAFIQGWLSIYDAYPNKASIGVLWAQNALETGGNGASCWNFNLGNIKAHDIIGENVEYCALNGVWEIVNGKKVILPSDDPGSWFRSFPTLKDGVRFYFDFLRNKRYNTAWVAVEHGDPINFCSILHDQGYYTASVESYSAGLVSRFNSFMKQKDFERALEELQKPVLFDPLPEPPAPEAPPASNAAPESVSPTPTPAPQKNFIDTIFAIIKTLLHIR